MSKGIGMQEETEITASNQFIDAEVSSGGKTRKAKKTGRGFVVLVSILITITTACSAVMGVLNYLDNKRQDDLYNKLINKIDVFTSQGNFSEARIENEREKYRWDNVLNALEKFFQAGVEEKAISQREEAHMLNNGIAVGRSSKGFYGMVGEEARQELIQQGFPEECIRLTNLVDTDKKHKKLTEGQVVSIQINGSEKFEAKDHFLPSSIIEIYCLKKDSRDASISDQDVPAEDSSSIIIGRKSTTFIGLLVDDAKQILLDQGFSDDNIKVFPINSSSKKYKNVEIGSIIKIQIGGKDKFGEMDRFLDDSIIELLYYAGQ